MRWQDAAIVIAMISAFLLFLLTRDARPDDCPPATAASTEKQQLCDRQNPAGP